MYHVHICIWKARSTNWLYWLSVPVSYSIRAYLELFKTTYHIYKNVICFNYSSSLLSLSSYLKIVIFPCSDFQNVAIFGLPDLSTLHSSQFFIYNFFQLQPWPEYSILFRTFLFFHFPQHFQNRSIFQVVLVLPRDLSKELEDMIMIALAVFGPEDSKQPSSALHLKSVYFHPFSNSSIYFV